MYCTQADLLNLLPAAELAQLTAESGDTPDAAVVAWAIGQAGAEIDSYLGVRYQLPLAEIPPVVKNVCADMAIYHLFSRRSGAPERRKEKYDAAVRWLKDVAAGRAQVPGAAGLEMPGAASDVVEIDSQTRIFDRDKMGGW